ncbi:helix-turn-helix domain-containing protein [Candidimonas nitroreducens]|uniref:Transcriptional regulator n=1 Tax=Candidimonas nitroreducens TaxID=683354 RepID=A0A225MZ45_9BURK|nr:XRE family transcriptional regulator [Candidimonas nitroreducens]OWT66384.1 transcriptional regulator [Candidimonas nitroreducens]
MAINLKILRIENGLTLEQLAQQTGLTRSYLSKVERYLSTPSIESALAIAKALGVSVDQLFGREQQGREPITITKASERSLRASPDGMDMVAGLNAGRIMRAFVIRPSRRASQGRLMSHHEGEEILYVLEGEIELHLARRKEFLSAGDCVHFDSQIPHKLIAVGGTSSAVLVVIASKDGDM